MKTQYIDEIDRLESTHWWHIAKKNIILRLLKLKGENSTKNQILEIGAGSGNLLSYFVKSAHTTALDINKTALKHCKKKGVQHLIYANIESYKGFKKNKYDVIIAADILEHIKKDTIVAKKLHSMLKKNGTLIVHVPADKKLFSYWDKMMGHERRYSQQDLCILLQEAGFTIKACSYRLFFLYPFVYIYRKFDKFLTRKKGGKESDFKQFPIFNSIFFGIASIEDYFIETNFIKFPFGLSLIAVATK